MALFGGSGDKPVQKHTRQTNKEKQDESIMSVSASDVIQHTARQSLILADEQQLHCIEAQRGKDLSQGRQRFPPLLCEEVSETLAINQ